MRLVVIGGDAGGASAAAQAKRHQKGWDVIMFDKGLWTSYAACGLPYLVGGLVSSIDDLVARSPEAHRKKGLDVRIRTEVTEIDTKSRRVSFVEVDSGRRGTEAYDLLVYATGARELRPPIDGLEHCRFVHKPGQAVALQEEIKTARHVVVAGGGYIGVEMAEAASMLGKDVVVIDAADQLMASLDPDMAGYVKKAMKERGIEVRLGTAMQKVTRRSGGGYAVETAGGAIETDLVIAGLGVRPETRLAEESGIALGDSGAVAVDHEMRTRTDGVFAAGDCAEAFHLVKKKWVNVPLGTVANKGGRVAGINAAGGRARLPGILGTAITRFFEWEIARTGLSEREAKELGMEVETGIITAKTASGYLPNAAPIHVKLLVEAGRRRIVGAQIVGGSGAGKRIDTLATAITVGMTADELIDLDLSYAPPFSPVWDPVQVAARRF